MVLVIKETPDLRIREVRQLLADVHCDLARERDRARVRLRFQIRDFESVMRRDDLDDLGTGDRLVLFRQKVFERFLRQIDT